MFDHGKMGNASEKNAKELEKHFMTNPPDGPELIMTRRLHTVAKVFLQVQQMRNEAGYDSTSEWTRMGVLAQIEAVTEAFKSWSPVREKLGAQAHLSSFLSKDHGPG